jgi:hypothetical protein
MPATLNQRVPCSELLIPTFFLEGDPDPRNRIMDLDPSMRRELLEKVVLRLIKESAKSKQCGTSK